jgi:hypothetical protein
MRHAKYFDKDLYSKWHRLHDGIAMCDVDSVEICMNKGCWKPLAIIEHLYDLNQTKKKYTTIVEHIGRALKVPVFLVYYKKSTGDTLSFRVAQKHPIRTPLTPHCEAEWVDILRSIQLKHKKVCLMNNSRAFLHITYKLYGHLDKLSGVKKSHVLNCYLSLMKHAWKKNNYECGLRYSTVAKDTKLSRITVRRTIDTLEKLNIISTVRGKSGKTYKVNDIFLKSEQDGSILYIPKSKMYNLDHPYVKKRSVLVEALNINSIDTIIGKYKGDKDTIIDQLAKLPPEELNQDTKNPYYVKLAIEKKEENARSKNRKFVHPQKILNELIKIKKQSNPRYVEKVSFNKRNNLDYKGNPKK